MAGFSGKNGSVRVGATHLYEVLGWDFDPKVAVPKWASNTTSGVKTGVPGVGDSSGKVEVKVHPANAGAFSGTLDLRPGQTVTLLLHADASGSNYISVQAIIENTPISVKVDPDGEPVSATYNFQGISNPIGYGYFSPGSGGSSSGPLFS